MASTIGSVSQTELRQRRRQLRQQRRVKSLQTSWRTLAVMALAGASVWVATLPAWVIRRPEQVTIEGNHFLSAQTIRSLLTIPYPQSLLKVEPQTIAQQLKAKAPIAEVAISRQLFAPGFKFAPGLVVQVKERYPVALSLPATTDSQSLTPKSVKLDSLPSGTGLIDESGILIPLESYTSLNSTLKLPTLRIIGNQDYYRPHWSKLYREVSRSPVKIFEVDWRDPTNLILKTELGTVHIGPYSTQFTKQLNLLDRMRKLSSLPSFSQISYIDLKNPDNPMVQMGKSKDRVKSDTP